MRMDYENMVPGFSMEHTMNMSQHYFPPFECTHILPSDNFCVAKLFMIRKEFPTLSLFKCSTFLTYACVTAQAVSKKF